VLLVAVNRFRYLNRVWRAHLFQTLASGFLAKEEGNATIFLAIALVLRVFTDSVTTKQTDH